jgi:hypothetical protein
MLLTEDGPWANDTVTLSYTYHLRRTLTLQAPSGSAWTQNYSWDAAQRLASVSSPAGAFGYQYGAVGGVTGASELIQRITYPSGALIDVMAVNYGVPRHFAPLRLGNLLRLR